jgi:hypothetical protein
MISLEKAGDRKATKEARVDTSYIQMMSMQKDVQARIKKMERLAQYIEGFIQEQKEELSDEEALEDVQAKVRVLRKEIARGYLLTDMCDQSLKFMKEYI